MMSDGMHTAAQGVIRAGNDCEVFGPGWLGQPVNALTSLAFAVAGLWILRRAFRGRDHGRTTELAVFGVVVGANAVGSVAYHGFRPWWGHWAHDLSILAVLLFISVHDAALVLGWSRPRTFGLYAVVLAGLAITLAMLRRATNPLSSVLAAAAGIGELGAWRGGYRPRPSEGWTPRTIGWLVVVVALVLGFASFLLGQSGSPVCRPGSLVQFHGLWHIFQAVVMGAYGAIEMWSPAPRATTGR
jgi:hypothetical protein